MQGKWLSLSDLCRQLLGDEFAPELERRAPVLFPFWKGWMLLSGKSFLRIVRLPLRLRSGLAAKAGTHSTSSVFRRMAQTPYKRLNFGSGPSTALRALTRGARLRLSDRRSHSRLELRSERRLCPRCHLGVCSTASTALLDL